MSITVLLNILIHVLFLHSQYIWQTILGDTGTSLSTSVLPEVGHSSG